MNSQWISINTNSTLLGSSSSTTTLRETTSDRISKSAMIGDAISGREKLWNNFI